MPVQAYFRAARRLPNEQASELSQAFFLWVMESGFLEKADRSRGRFRPFLKTALRHFANDDARVRRAEKRGGRQVTLSLDHPGDEGRESLLPVRDQGQPDAALDDAWRETLLARALEATEKECSAKGRAQMLSVFRDHLVESGGEDSYATLAERHGVTPTDVMNWLSAVKDVYRRALKRIVMETVSGPGELDEEIRWLLSRKTET